MVNIPQPIKKKFYKKIWFWCLLIAILMIGGCGGGGYYSYQKMQNNNTALEQEAAVEYKDLQKTVSLEGEIQSKKQADLYFGASGKVKEVQISIGDFVEEDQLLAKIEDTDMATSKQKEIKAPFSGLIIAVNVFDGMPVTAQTTAITIASEETEIIANASDNEVINLKNEQIANITFDSLPDIILRATVRSVGEEKNSDSAQSLTSTSSTSTASGYEIKLDYDKPSDLNLKRDMGCNIEITVAEIKQVLAIPLAAIKWEDNQSYVNIKNGQTTEKRNIEIGFEGDEYVEIISGLNLNDKIVLFSQADIPKPSMF